MVGLPAVLRPGLRLGRASCWPWPSGSDVWRPPHRPGPWLLLGWGAGVAATIYVTHVAIVVFWWLYGLRRVPWPCCSWRRRWPSASAPCGRCAGQGLVGLAFRTDNSALVGEAVRRWTGLPASDWAAVVDFAAPPERGRRLLGGLPAPLLAPGGAGAGGRVPRRAGVGGGRAAGRAPHHAGHAAHFGAAPGSPTSVPRRLLPRGEGPAVARPLAGGAPWRRFPAPRAGARLGLAAAAPWWASSSWRRTATSWATRDSTPRSTTA